MSADLAAAESRPHSILVIDQSDLRGPFYNQIFSALRDVVVADADAHVTVYSESLDLSRFGGEDYDVATRELLKVKYRDKPVDVIVATGGAALERVLNWRGELWPDIPVVFALVGAAEIARLRPPPDVTGSMVGVAFADAVKSARAVVPHLQTIVLVGDSWDRKLTLGHWRNEIPAATAALNVIDITGSTMTETRRRVASLPERSAIIYSAMYGDGEGAHFPPSTALKFIAETANRPIIVAAETLLAPGGIGGYALIPEVVGTDAARLVLRILHGEHAKDIPPREKDATIPLFNWQQMQRWGVRQADLPPGSEIRFREATMWERYRWIGGVAFGVILLQAGLISILLHERKRRSDAEREARSRMSELAHLNRQATAGELSSSIAHELNQPLGAILTNAETAELILKSPTPDLLELREILSDIRRDDLRANEVIHRLRSLLKRAPFEVKTVDLNDLMREVFGFLAVQASVRKVVMYFQPSSDQLQVRGDPVQLQQVILNLIVNSMEAMSAMPNGRTVVGRTELNDGSSARVSILDAGPGIPPEKLGEVFDPFFTTKQQGMGVGLSIARTIVQAHKGKIWAENQPEGGAVFHFSMPLALH
jgi:signal transduction histidine kinase